ncbi:MAG TPA: general stress protein [Caldilineaceae bacterium]|nr:general stress protein [Caldilineaceae bacterium]
MSNALNERIGVPDVTETAAQRVVATYGTYREAQQAVDFLSDRRFPVNRVRIVAEGLRFVEQVTGRTTWGSALLNGAIAGAVTGVLFGFIFGLFSFIQPLVSALTLALYGLIFGAIVGALIGLIAYGASGGRRDFSSVSGIQADRYNVMVDAEAADEAARLLVEMPAEIR